MTHNWLCLWVKQIPYFHTRLLSTFSHHLLGRNNGLPGDVACLQSAAEELSSQSELILNTERLNGDSNCLKESAKKDLLSSKSWPLIGVRNQELINCLRKMIKPVQNIETIHVSKTIHKGNEIEVANDINELSKFSTFCSFDEPFNKDLHTLQSNYTQSRSAQTSTKSVSEFSKDSDRNISEENDDDSNRKGPTIAQLEEVKRFYIRSAPHFFRRGEPMNEGRHDPDIVFENHLRKRPRTTVGIKRYIAELSKIRIVVGIMFPSCSLRIRNINIHPENGYVRIHWCALYTTDILIWSRFFSFFSSKDSNSEKKKFKKEWDFISTVYVNKQGKIVKHIVDRKIPINEKRGTVEEFAVKTAGIVGLSHEASYKDHREDPAT
ncbi:hypothetical protein ACF0H5_021757 [Mactra antiquata]